MEGRNLFYVYFACVQINVATVFTLNCDGNVLVWNETYFKIIIYDLRDNKAEDKKYKSNAYLYSTYQYTERVQKYLEVHAAISNNKNHVTSQWFLDSVNVENCLDPVVCKP